MFRITITNYSYVQNNDVKINYRININVLTEAKIEYIVL